MKIEGNKPTQGPDGRRFSAGRASAPKESGKSFGAILKKASAEAAPAPAPSTPAPAADSAAAPVKAAEGKAEEAADAAGGEAAFADHMETVRFRLRTGYYTSKAIDDALTDKLTGYFDELA